MNKILTTVIAASAILVCSGAYARTPCPNNNCDTHHNQQHHDHGHHNNQHHDYRHHNNQHHDHGHHNNQHHDYRHHNNRHHHQYPNWNYYGFPGGYGSGGPTIVIPLR